MEIMNEYLAIIKNYLVNTDNYIPLYIALGFLFINYIIALIKSRNESIIAISGWGDLIIVLSPIFGFLIMMVIGIVFMPETNTEEFLDKLLFYYFISFGIALVITLFYSISSNRNNIFNIIVSFFAKLFIMLFSALMVLSIMLDWFRHKKDKRTKDGSRGNSKTASKIVFIGIAGLIIYPLVSKRKYIDVQLAKSHKKNKEIEELLNQ